MNYQLSRGKDTVANNLIPKLLLKSVTLKWIRWKMKSWTVSHPNAESYTCPQFLFSYFPQCANFTEMDHQLSKGIDRAQKRFSISCTVRIFAEMDASNVPWASRSQPETIRSKRSKQILFLDIFNISNNRKRESQPTSYQLLQVFVSPRQRIDHWRRCEGSCQALLNIKSVPPATPLDTPVTGMPHPVPARP